MCQSADTTAPTKGGLLCKPGLAEPATFADAVGSHADITKLLGIDDGRRYVAAHVNQLTMPRRGDRVTVIAPGCVATQGEFDGR